MSSPRTRRRRGTKPAARPPRPRGALARDRSAAAPSPSRSMAERPITGLSQENTDWESGGLGDWEIQIEILLPVPQSPSPPVGSMRDLVRRRRSRPPGLADSLDGNSEAPRDPCAPRSRAAVGLRAPCRRDEGPPGAPGETARAGREPARRRERPSRPRAPTPCTSPSPRDDRLRIRGRSRRSSASRAIAAARSRGASDRWPRARRVSPRPSRRVPLPFP